MSLMSKPGESDDFATLANMWRAIEAFEAGTWDEVELTIDGRRIVLSADGTRVDAAGPAVLDRASATRPPAPTSDASTRPTIDHPAEPAAAAEQPAPAATLPTPGDESLVAITSPTVGIFYAQPEPGAPPFVQEGDRVDADTTVCIIEIMKLMNHVKASVNGRVARVLVDNAASIEQGQTLFLVEREPT